MIRFLKEDIYSHVKKYHLYGSKGDRVKVVADHGEVAIVEDIKGERFAVRMERLTTDEIKTEETPPPPEVEKKKIEWLPKGPSAMKRDIAKTNSAPAGKQIKLF